MSMLFFYKILFMIELLISEYSFAFRMKKKKHFLSMILGLALSLTILFPSFAQASEIPNQLLSSYEYDDTVNEIVRKHLNFDSIDFKRNNHITI